MSNGFIVLDKPGKCEDCIMMVEGYDGNHIWTSKCKASSIDNLKVILDKKSCPNWCPIRYLPERREGYFDIIVAPYGSGVQKGWNECVDFLEGKKNG